MPQKKSNVKVNLDSGGSSATYKPQSKKSLQEEQPQQSPVYQEEVRPEISYERKYSGKIELRNVPMTKNSKEFIVENPSVREQSRGQTKGKMIQNLESKLELDGIGSNLQRGGRFQEAKLEDIVMNNQDPMMDPMKEYPM